MAVGVGFAQAVIQMIPRFLRGLVCVATVTAVTFGGLGAGASVPAGIPAENAGSSVEAPHLETAASVVRLRKLHLVRPDLIPYPIAYEVCC